MTTRLPLPPRPTLDAFTRTTHPVLAATTQRLLEPRAAVAMYEDSPYIALKPKPDPEPEPDEDDNGPWCRTAQP